MLTNEEIYRVALLGHRDFNAHRQLEERLVPLLEDLMRRKPFLEIHIGRDGEFDVFAASVVKRVQSRLGSNNCDLILVLPYGKKDIQYYEDYYDCVCTPIYAYPKLAISKRNEWMVERADLILCYIERESGGAYKAVKYAIKLGKEVVNLA